MTNIKSIPSVSVNYACNGSSTNANAMGMRVMQERAYEKRGEQYLLIKSPPASGMLCGLIKSVHQRSVAQFLWTWINITS